MAATAPGFDASHVSPQDAIVTLRSLRRRFAEAFDQAEDPADLIRSASGGGLSPRDHAAATATALDVIGAALARVMVAEDPEIALPSVDPAGPAVPPGDDPVPAPATVLAWLGDVAGSVADAMAGIHGDDWTRTGRTAVGQVTALDIARLGVRIGIEHLRAAQRAVRPASR